MYREIKMIVRASVFACFVLCALPVRAQMTGAVGGTVNRTGPALPRILLNTHIDSTNMPSLFQTQETKPCTGTTKTCMVTVQASGGTYTSLASAFSSISTDNPNGEAEIITVTAGYTSDSAGDSAAGVTYSDCPTNKSNFIWVRSSAFASLPAQGTMVTPSFASDMFNVTQTGVSQNNNKTLVISDGACNLIVTGMELNMMGHSIEYGVFNGSSTNTTGFANHILFDRDYFHGSYSTLINNAVSGNASFVAITDSYFDGINVLSSDACNTYSESHDFIAWNTPGPIKLVDNFFGGAPTENVFFGGATQALNGQNPADIEIRQNIMYKDPSQIPNSDAKNNAEFKAGVRVLFDGNILLYSFSDFAACGGNQQGVMLDLNPQNPSPVSTTTLAEDSNVTLTNNVFQHGNSGISVLGYATSMVSTFPVGAYDLISNNLFQDINHWVYGGSPVYTTTAASVSGGVVTLTLPSTTGVTLGTSMAIFGFTGADAQLNGTGTFNSGSGIQITSINTSTKQLTYNCSSCTNETATSNGTVFFLDKTIAPILEITTGGPPPTYAKTPPGPYNVTLSQNGMYGASPVNGAYVIYVNKPNPPCGGASSNNAVFPNFTFTGNVSVLDTNRLMGDGCSGTPASWITDGVVPNMFASGNVLFNFLESGGVCSNWTPLNPGTCPTGVASSPSTINSTLGISNFATCSAGDANTSALPLPSITSCEITGTFAAAGPNIPQIIAHETLGNDTTLWGTRTQW